MTFPPSRPRRVARVFTPGASLDEIGTWLEAVLDARVET
jgi:hypothetical protein